MGTVEQRRAARVPTAPYRVRIGRDEGYLVDLSETGALIQAIRRETPSRSIRLDIDLESQILSLPARVVRCNPHKIQLDGAVWNKQEYRIGVEFGEYGRRERQILVEVIGRC